MNYYPFHIGDFRSGTINMSRQARWIYRDMMDVYYDSEKPLSLDLDVLCDSIGVVTEEERKDVQRLLRFKFKKTDDGYRHDVCDEVISDFHQKAEIARSNGKLGGRKKNSNKASQKKPGGLPMGTDSVHSATPDPARSQANQEPRTINQEPSSVPTGTGGKPPLTTDEIIFGYGVPLLTNAGTADKQARSFLGGLRKTHGDHALVNALRECIRAGPLQPLEWLAKMLPPTGTKKPNKQEELEARNAAVGEAWLKKMEQQDEQQSTG